MKPGDTVDPQTLPVGAVFKHVGQETQFRVTEAGKLAESGRFSGLVIGTMRAVIVSLPQPIADEAVELGTLQRSEFFQLHESEFGFPGDAEFRGLILHCGIGGYQNRYILAELGTGRRVELSTDRKVRRVPAPTPAKRPPCDACGEESHVDLSGKYVIDKQPAELCGDCFYRKHSSRTIDDVRARRAKNSGSTGPGHCAHCHTPTKADGSRGCLPGCSPKPTDPRWSTTDPSRIAALEARLAEQVRGGGQDCQSARRLVERADDLFLAEHERAHVASEKRIKASMHRRWLGEQGVEGCEPGIQAGPRLMRHELPREQRLNRNRTGR